MTAEIATVLVILVSAIVLFASERLRPDLTGLLVLIALAVTGLLTPEQALSGFSSPAVITVWAMFMLSGGLIHSGTAAVASRQVLRFAGDSEVSLIVVIMITVGLCSAFMNNVGAAALLLPVVMDLARRTRLPPSRLLMPLAAASLLGGMITQIGTPPNILVSAFMRREAITPPLGMFAYAPTGLLALAVGTAFVALVGRRLLPHLHETASATLLSAADLGGLYDLTGRMQVLRLENGSSLAGLSLAESRLGAALGLNVIAIVRDGRLQLAPAPDIILSGGDRLVVEGRFDGLGELLPAGHLLLEDAADAETRALTMALALAHVRVREGSALVGASLRGSQFRQRFEVNALAISRGGEPVAGDLRDATIRAGDRILVQGEQAQLVALATSRDFTDFGLATDDEAMQIYGPEERLIAMTVPAQSALVGSTLADSRLGDAFGLTVLAILRAGKTLAAPEPGERLQASDGLIVKGCIRDLLTLAGLEALEVDQAAVPGLEDLESDGIALAEAVLAPHTHLTGKSLLDMRFRERYGLNVLAVWREGRAIRSNLGQVPLRLGDALLLHGRRDKLRLLATEPDFLVLTVAATEAPAGDKAAKAALVMASVVAAAMFGILPIAIAAVLGAAAMVLGGCLTMDEAYRHVEWQAVFLIAAMLPLGLAMQETGAAQLVARLIGEPLGGLGPLAVLGGLYLLGASAVQFVPNSAVAVLMAPIAADLAADIGVSPVPLLMAVAMSASAGFMSPTGHAVNVMVMGPGGYRFRDYARFGLGLLLLMLLVVVVVVPLLWPFGP